MAFARHNVEKQRLIEMVRMNPILWDCRLPHYKRSDKKKDMKWCELGRAFNVSGERVQRTFTSLREIFRRELNHEKMLGDRFTSKWEYYDSMNFLRDVIRERKSKDRYRQAANNNTNKQDAMDGGDYPAFQVENRNTFHAPQPDVVIDNSTPAPDNSLSRSTSPGFSIKEEPFEHDDSEKSNEDLSLITHAAAYQNQSNVGHPPGQNETLTMHRKRKASNACANPNQKKNDNFPSACVRQTPREILYAKFGDFLSARLNTLNETASNDLMNRILMLIAET